MKQRISGVIAALAALANSIAVPATARAFFCTDNGSAVYETQDLGLPVGRYTLPSNAPEALVALAHGYTSDPDGLTGRLLEGSEEHGVLAFAMANTGIGPAPGFRGWNVRAGAEDTIAVAKRFLELCPTIKKVLILGISMGGNTSGLAVAAAATRDDGSTPLFDYWVDVMGATNVTETYLEATVVGPANTFAAGAKQDIEAEMGGTPADKPQNYVHETVVARAADIAASGLSGAVVLHGVDDGLVPYDQGREMATVLRAAGIPTDLFTVLRRGSDNSGTTLSGSIVGLADPAYRSPFAGHGSTVVNTGFDRLWAIVDGAAGAQPGLYREFLVDSELGTVPSP